MPFNPCSFLYRYRNPSSSVLERWFWWTCHVGGKRFWEGVEPCQKSNGYGLGQSGWLTLWTSFAITYSPYSMGNTKIAPQIKQRLLRQAVHRDALSFSNELAEDEATCSNCKDSKIWRNYQRHLRKLMRRTTVFMNDSRRVLVCGHEICFDCTLDLMNSAIMHDGVLQVCFLVNFDIN